LAKASNISLQKAIDKAGDEEIFAAAIVDSFVNAPPITVAATSISRFKP
jgi:hypothetical protein